MSSVQLFKVVALFLALVLASCCLFADSVTGGPVSVEKRDIHRYPRAKYRVGYLFGKRSSSVPSSSVLFDILSRKIINKHELAELAMENRQLFNEIATILDKNGDGYISISDLVTQDGK